MPKFIYLSFILGILGIPTISFSSESSTLSDQPINYFTYTSERCKNIKDVQELYRTALSLRDSKDEKERVDAVDCLLSAASRGHGPSEFEIAKMYNTGTILPLSPSFAYRWAQLAVMDKYSDAIPLRDRLEAQLSPDELESSFESVKKIYQERIDAISKGKQQYTDPNNTYYSQPNSVNSYPAPY